MEYSTTTPKLRKALGLWTLGSIAMLAYMLMHTSVDARFLGRYSATYALMLMGMLVSIFTTGALGLTLRETWIDFLRPHLKKNSLQIALIIVGVVGIIAFWWFMPGSRDQPPIGVFFLHIIATWISLIILLLWLGDAHKREVKYLPIWIVILGLLVVGIVIPLIGQYPTTSPTGYTYWEEDALLSRGYYTASNGITSTSPVVALTYIAHYANTPLTLWVTGQYLHITQGGFAEARFIHYAASALSALFVYLISKRWYNRNIALFVALLMPLMALPHSYVRGDTYVAPILGLALYAYVRAQEGTWRWHFVVGFSLAFAIEGQQNGIRFAFIFGVWYSLYYIRLIMRAKRWWHPAFWALVAGGLAYTSLYFIVRVGLWAERDIGFYMASLQTGYDIESAITSTSYLQRIANNLATWIPSYIVARPLEMLIIVMGLVGAFWRRYENDAFLWFMLAGSFIAFMFISPKPSVFYLVHHLPLVGLLAGAILFYFTKLNTLGFNRLALSLVLFAFALQSTIIFQQQHGTQSTQLDITTADLREALPDDVQHYAGAGVTSHYLAVFPNKTYYPQDLFSNTTMADLQRDYDAPTIQAVIGINDDRRVDLGRTDSLVDLRPLITELDMQLWRCVDTANPERKVQIYVIPDVVPNVSELEQGC